MFSDLQWHNKAAGLYITLMVADVAFRSAKAVFFRGAKDDNGSAILNRTKYRS